MPFTPFHFGPGLLIKGCVPKHFSWTAFAAAQVVIDCEALYYLGRNEYPIHRSLHTLPGAALAGVLTAVVIIGGKWAIRKFAPKLAGAFHSRLPTIRSESSTSAIWIGGLVGGISHPLLDGLMHQDVRPFWPLTSANPLLGAVGLNTLLDACVIAGMLGLIMIGFWLVRESKAS